MHVRRHARRPPLVGRTAARPYVHHGHCASLYCDDGFSEHRFQGIWICDRAESHRALGGCHAGEINLRTGNALADPPILNRAIPRPGYALLMLLIVEERT